MYRPFPEAKALRVFDRFNDVFLQKESEESAEEITKKPQELISCGFFVISYSLISFVWFSMRKSQMNSKITEFKRNKKKPRNHFGFKVFCGAAGRIRTADLILTKRFLMFFITISACF